MSAYSVQGKSSQAWLGILALICLFFSQAGRAETTPPLDWCNLSPEQVESSVPEDSLEDSFNYWDWYNNDSNCHPRALRLQIDPFADTLLNPYWRGAHLRMPMRR